MNENRPVPMRTLTQTRERTIDVLCRAFAEDALEMDEFEGRLDRANAAASLEELDGLVSDLPAALDASGAPMDAPPPDRTSPGDAVTPAAAGTRAPPPATLERSHYGFAIALLGGARRRGRWRPPDHLVVTAVMGGVELDFREAELPVGETRVTIFTFWGGVDITVPPGMRVEVNGVALMAGFDDQSDHTSADEGGPVLRIDGVAIMAGVNVKVRRPGETEKEAKQRSREERRLRRLERKAERTRRRLGE